MGLRFFIIGETTTSVCGMACTSSTFQLCIKEREGKEKKKKKEVVPVSVQRHNLKSRACLFLFRDRKKSAIID